MELFPEDGRPYVSLGKLMVQQRRYDEALALYEEGCTATGGTNAHIWAAWAYLAAKKGNASLARKLYDAAIVANPQHAAAWHGWGLLEKDQGNFLRCACVLVWRGVSWVGVVVAPAVIAACFTRCPCICALAGPCTPAVPPPPTPSTPKCRARDLWLQGIQALRRQPNPYLYQSLAVLASEMDCVEEARKWFREGTRTLTVRGWCAWSNPCGCVGMVGSREEPRPRFER